MELVDFSAGFPSASAIKSAGFGGVIGYFSEARASWMKAKPMNKYIVDQYSEAGLTIVCNYQFGKGDTADWREGFDGGKQHAMKMRDLLRYAGLGDATCAKYGPVDDNPTEAEYERFVRPFFLGWQSIFGLENTGAYCNTHTINWLAKDNLCDWYWQHAWDGINKPALQKVNPKAHIIQYEIDKSSIQGIGIDRNRTLKPTFGQVGHDDGLWADNLLQMIGPRA